jgi:hypothetical protein
MLALLSTNVGERGAYGWRDGTMFATASYRQKGFSRRRTMMVGMSMVTFTVVHVVVSLIGMFSGVIILGGMFRSYRLPGWTALFLTTTVLTSVTGFGFPSERLLPSHIVGVISLGVLAVAILARYGYQLAGSWRWIYVASAGLALYLNVFVGVVQAFQKLPFLQSLAPTQAKPPFLLTQLAVLALFVGLTLVAVLRFHHEQLRAA